MKFVYQYRTPDNIRRDGEVNAATRDAAFALLKTRGIRPSRLDEAPGFFNKLWGKGKRWLAIALLTGAVVAATFTILANRRTIREIEKDQSFFDSPVRRQPLGDAVVIEQGIRTGWADVFELEGERFLASFAVPGVEAGVRSTTEAELRKALDNDALKPQRTHSSLDGSVQSIEARQIRAMVEGIKSELRIYLAAGGSISAYGARLVQRQEQEIGYFKQVKAELESAKKTGMQETDLERLWEARNNQLRKMGIKLVPLVR